MNTNDLKPTWEESGASQKDKSTLASMTRVNHHPIWKKVRSKLIIEAILLVICTLVLTETFAQSKISGRVVNNTGKPLEFVTVALYHAKDSSLQRGTVSTANGHFILEKVNTGQYFITMSMIGYATSNSKTIHVLNNDETYELPDFILNEEVHALKEVTVAAKKQFVEQQADKMVINPEASITTASDDALEVLRKSPGVIIDKDDNIVLKNKQIQILVDGRSTHLSGAQLAAMLRNMQASSIERIEIIENPSSRYDAEGDAGIINIRTKRGMMRGYNGSAVAGIAMGKRFSNNYGVTLNYRNEKWNIYGNYYGGIPQGWNDVDLTRYFTQSDGSVFKQYSESDRNAFYNSIKLGADYYITPKQIIGIMAQGNFSTGDVDVTSNGLITGASGEDIQHIATTTTDNTKNTNLLMNLNYQWTIDNLGQELSVDANVGSYSLHNRNDMNTSYVPLINPLIIQKDQDGTANFYSMKADYVKPLSKKARMEAGFKFSYTQIDNDLGYLQQDENGNWADPNHMSNRFIYSENINAAYVSGQYRFTDKTSVQLGFRGEQTVIKGDNVTIDEVNSRDYFNLFPTFFAMHKFSDRHQLGLSYSYRIGRPPYQILNPFIWMLDPYTYNKGNPFLNAQFTHNGKLAYTLNRKYIFSIDASYTKDAWTQVFEQDDATRTVVISWENLNNYYNTSMSIVLPISITKWWNTNTNLIGFYGQYKSDYQNGTIDQSQFTFRGNTTFTFMLPKDFAVELSGWYMSKAVYGMTMMGARGSMDMGVQKLFKDRRISLKLSFSDVLGTQKNAYTSKYGNVDLKGIQHSDSRRANLTFTWRFGRNDIKAARQRSTGLEEETSRTGQ